MAAKKKTPEAETEPTSTEPAEKPKRLEAAPVMEIDLSEEAGDDEGDDDEEEKKLSRREKKQARGSLREEAEKLRERAALAEQQAAYATGVAQTMAQRMQQPQEQRDPLDFHQEGAQREQRLLVQEYQQRVKRGELSKEEHDDFESRGNAIQAKLAEIAAERVLRRQQSQQPQGQNVMAVLQARYPEVVSNQQAFAYAIARYRTLVSDPIERAPDNWDTAERVMQETKERFGMAAPKNGSERSGGNTRRYEGGGAGASGNVKGEAPTKITLTKDDVAAADAAYPHLPEKERYTRYAKIAQASRKTA